MRVSERYTITVNVDPPEKWTAADAFLIPVLVRSTELDSAINSEGKRTPRALAVSFADGTSLCRIVCADANLARAVEERVAGVGRYHYVAEQWQEVQYSAVDQLWKKHREAEARTRAQEWYWLAESGFGWLSTAQPRALHGVYKQLIPNRKGRYANGNCRRFMEHNPERAPGMALFVAKSLEREDMPHHAAKVYRQYDLAQYRSPGEAEWDAIRAMRAAEQAREEQRVRTEFSAAVVQVWGTEEQLDFYIAQTWPTTTTIPEAERASLKRIVVRYGENRWWERKHDAEAALPQLFEPHFLLPIERFLNGCAQLIGRPISLIEYAFGAEQVQLEVLAKVERSVLDALKADETTDELLIR